MFRMRGQTEKIGPALVHSATKGQITRIEIGILLALQRTGSQNKAAAELGISVPVLNKRIAGINRKMGVAVVEATPLHSRLTAEGRMLVEGHLRAVSRLEGTGLTAIGASALTGPCLRDGLEDGVELIIASDEFNLAAFKMGVLDLAVIDDPGLLMGLSAGESSILVERVEEVGSDVLLHMRKGPRYMRFAYGAQGLGFRYLEQSGRPFEISGRTYDIEKLFDSGLSFFLNRRLLEWADIGPAGTGTANVGERTRKDRFETTPSLSHTINAIVLKGPDRTEVESLLLTSIINDLRTRLAGER